MLQFLGFFFRSSEIVQSFVVIMFCSCTVLVDGIVGGWCGINNINLHVERWVNLMISFTNWWKNLDHFLLLYCRKVNPQKWVMMSKFHGKWIFMCRLLEVCFPQFFSWSWGKVCACLLPCSILDFTALH